MACDIFDRGQPYVTVFDTGEGVNFGPTKCDIFFEWPLGGLGLFSITIAFTLAPTQTCMPRCLYK